MAVNGKQRKLHVGLSVAICVVVAAFRTKPSQAGAAPGEQEWLQIVNRYRASASIDPVTENPEATAGAKKHSDYLVVNREVGHEEYPNKRGFSREGLRAGKTGNVFVAYNLPVSPQREVVEGLLAAPFHGLAILNPEYTSFGFATSGTKSYWAATMPVFWDKYLEPTDEELSANVQPDWDAALARVLKKYPDFRRASGNVSFSGTADRILIEGEGAGSWLLLRRFVNLARRKLLR